MKNIVLLAAYDGTHYLGWQKTKEGPSIEADLERVLQQILQEKITLQAASRTDAGVHAAGQVVNFYTEKTRLDITQLIKSCNALLQGSIIIIAGREMPIEFHPTLDVIEKSYHYSICYGPYQYPKNRYFSWHVPYNLNVNKMKWAAQYLEGEHDFSSFCNQRKDLVYPHKVRRINKIQIIEIERFRLEILISGDHFLYKMARNIVGTLVYVGREKISSEEIPAILESRSRSQAGMTAPAHGLTLKHVSYANLQF